LVGRALVEPVEICAPGACYSRVSSNAGSGVTDRTGSFAFSAVLADGWSELLLQVTSEGHEPTAIYITPAEAVNAELLMLRTITIRPGDSIDMRLFPGSYVCGWLSYLCRRIIVDSPSGAPVDVEVIPARGEDVGLLQSSEPFGHSLPRRLTMTAGAVWIYPLSQLRRVDSGSASIGVFEQHVTLRVLLR
jgi:hypothetical protein